MQASISSPNPSECATPDVGDVRSKIIKRERAGICWVLSSYDCIKKSNNLSHCCVALERYDDQKVHVLGSLYAASVPG